MFLTHLLLPGASQALPLSLLQAADLFSSITLVLPVATLDRARAAVTRAPVYRNFSAIFLSSQPLAFLPPKALHALRTLVHRLSATFVSLFSQRNLFEKVLPEFVLVANKLLFSGLFEGFLPTLAKNESNDCLHATLSIS